MQEAEVQGRCRVGKGAYAERVDAGLGDRAHGLEVDAAGGLERRRALRGGVRRAADRLAQRASCCRAARRRRCRAPRRLVEVAAPRPRPASGCARRAAVTASGMLPAAAMWFSLMRMASKRPIRWLRPPPGDDRGLLQPAQARRRLPGVEDPRLGPGDRVDVAGASAWRRRRGAEEVQRRALGGEHRRGPDRGRSTPRRGRRGATPPPARAPRPPPPRSGPSPHAPGRGRRRHRAPSGGSARSRWSRPGPSPRRSRPPRPRPRPAPGRPVSLSSRRVSSMRSAIAVRLAGNKATHAGCAFARAAAFNPPE